MYSVETVSGLRGLIWYKRYEFKSDTHVLLPQVEHFLTDKELSKNYVVKNKGMKSTRFLVYAETAFYSESSWTPNTQPNESKAAVWLSFWCSSRPSVETGTD